MTLPISVIVPVGPTKAAHPLLVELLDSLWEQTLKPAEIVIIDDAAHISDPPPYTVEGIPVKIITNPWNLGEAASRNIGTAMASHPWVFQASYDDLLESTCLEACAEEVEKRRDEMGYYYVTLQIGESDVLQTEMGAHALFSRKLWASLGGYPPVGGMGLADIPFLDLVIVYGKHVYPVAQGNPLYYHREHDENQIKGVSGTMRKLARMAANENTKRWQPPSWTKGFGF